MKTVTLLEAIASGRRFRSVLTDLEDSKPNHRSLSGHFWRLAASKTGFVKCVECGGEFIVPPSRADRWKIEETDEELDQRAKEIVQNLGLRIKETT